MPLLPFWIFKEMFEASDWLTQLSIQSGAMNLRSFLKMIPQHVLLIFKFEVLLGHYIPLSGFLKSHDISTNIILFVHFLH